MKTKRFYVIYLENNKEDWIQYFVKNGYTRY